MSPRPHVSPRIEKNLALRNGNACAYPKCGDALTFEAAHPEDESKVVGKVAHIAAASPGGPRYDASMTDAERSSIDNLIFLCGTHHDAIDNQLHFHTTQYLLGAKRNHEALVRRSVRTALGQIGFAELEAVCASLAGVSATPGSVQMPLDVNDKIELNGLGDDSRASISDGMALVGTVATYIDAMRNIDAGLGERLSARFKAAYFEAVGEGLDSDGIFDHLVWTAMEHHGATVNANRQAAALAVVVYLFERCEVFESAPGSTK
ncbi:ABC-three component system protein [Aeromicrobium sp. CTD01-1L150]|uniref:ABC-three component system protein n=1 Tax=Aeromicrobium sp. CTD01-1L150 TaxID=3341830 RepID=UPI0035BF0ADA